MTTGAVSRRTRSDPRTLRSPRPVRPVVRVSAPPRQRHKPGRLCGFDGSRDISQGGAGGASTSDFSSEGGGGGLGDLCGAGGGGGGGAGTTLVASWIANAKITAGPARADGVVAISYTPPSTLTAPSAGTVQTASCDAVPTTIVGTAGDNRFTGTPRSDVI